MMQYEKEDIDVKVMSQSISGYALLNGMDLEDDEEGSDGGSGTQNQPGAEDNLPQYHDYETLVNEESYINSTLLNNSPTKPLNFPHHKAKEFNSSSDTYTSEPETGGATMPKHPPKQADMFDRNFSFDNSQDAIKTVKTVPGAFETAAVATDIIPALLSKESKPDAESSGDDDPFFKTPLTSTTDLSPEKTINRAINNSSPSKSIMKKKDTPSASPTKKSVVFTQQIPEIHLYKKEETATEDEYLIQLQLQLPLDNSWAPVSKSDELSSDDDEEEPPAPPPHTENDLRAISHDEGHMEEQVPSTGLDTNKLKDLRKKGFSRSSSNLSLNEKLDIFLSKRQVDNNATEIKDTDAMDDHLNRLEASRANQLDSNIRDLSLKLQTKELKEMENPLNSFSRSSNVDIMSGNTSRSSIQSLKDEDRVLESSNVVTVAKSVELNDGIKGFSDHMVESLLPESEENKLSTNAADLTKSLPRIGTLDRQFVDSSNDEFHDSFDQSYNNTEQSIMDLLKRQSSLRGQPLVNETAIKREILLEDLSIVKSEPKEPQIPIKQENEVVLAPVVKDEPEDVFFTPLIKQEEMPNVVEEETMKDHETIKRDDTSTSKLSILPDLRRDLEHIHRHPTEIASVSGFGVHHDSSSSQLVLTPALGSTNSFKEDNSNSVNEVSHQFSLRDHIDSDWKFEDSNDGDREDNDEYTNNEITKDSFFHNSSVIEDGQLGHTSNVLDCKEDGSIVREQEEKEIEKEEVQEEQEKKQEEEKELEEEEQEQEKIVRLTSKRLLEIDLSPAISRQVSRDESVRSLAPPKIDSPIKSPVRSFTFERNVSQNGSPIKQGRIQNLPAPMEAPKEAQFEPRELFKNFDKESEQLDDVHVSPTENIAEPHVVLKDTVANGTGNETEDEIKDASNSVDVDSSERLKIEASHDENEALANSSNVAPNEDITLPPVDLVSHHFSIDEITKNMKKNLSMSFEESLSAEYDQNPTSPTNFISIWHSQEKHAKAKQAPDNHMAYEVLQQNMKLPSSLQPKNFKEVNVITRRIVSPGYEDLNVSGFLPELSQDSGFGNQFKEIVKSRDNTTDSTKSDSFNESNHESNSVVLPKSLTRNSEEFSSYYSDESVKPQKSRLMPPKANFKPVVVKRSQFKVPSFEIKRGNSILSPRNQYDDIYSDTIKPRKYLPAKTPEEELQQVLGVPPTIKSSGMKTLPSMDRDDVQKILNTKRIISQEEYSKLKLIGNKKKESLIQPEDKYDHLQQQASIHNAYEEDDDEDLSSNTIFIDKGLPNGANVTHRAVMSTPTNGGRSVQVDNSILPHLADELLRVPSALLSKDQFFKESEFSSPVRVNEAVDTSDDGSSSRVSSVIHTKKPQTLAPKHVISQHFPEPDPELCHDIFKTPPKELNSTMNSTEDEQAQQRLLAYDAAKDATRKNRSYHHSSTPIKKNPGSKANSPIKIGSPIVIVKDKVTGGVSAVPSPKKKKFRDEISFSGNDLSYDKLRESPQKKINDLQAGKASTTPNTSIANTSSSSADFMSHHGKEKRKVSNQLLATLDNSSKKPLSERGRLFLRIVGLKNLDLPDLDSKQAEFSLTLDNGVHCIKTPNYNLNARNISIGKEFELTVAKTGLEFILTMKASYEKPKGGLREVHERKVVKSKNRFSRLLGSKEVVHTTKFVPTEVVDTWENKFAQDGSFARCYIDFDQYEGKITGKVSSFDVTCFNEWATVSDSNGEKIKCKPYRIGQLEVKMLFIPKTVHEEVLPSSIKSAYESVNSLQHQLSLYNEGYLHQEGGDCDIWKRRYFKLEGTSLIAHSEYTHKTRAKINLAKVVEIIYVDKENSKSQSKNLRNFSDVLLLEHAFKIKFGNGEIIDFGAPNNTEKMQWISIIEKIIERNKFRVQPWVKIMLQCNNIKQVV